MDWGWPQEHLILKQCRTTLKDGQARDQRPIGLQIDLWPLAQPSLRVVLHCFRWKWSWSHPQVRFEAKIGCSLRSCILEAVYGGQLIFGTYLTLISPPFLFQIWIGGRVVPYKHDRACDPLVVGVWISPRHKQDTFSADQFKCTISRAGAHVDLFWIPLIHKMSCW